MQRLKPKRRAEKKDHSYSGFFGTESTIKSAGSSNVWDTVNTKSGVEVIRDNFIQSMDSSTSGIHANMNKGMALTDLTTNQKNGFNCQIFEPWSSIHVA